jgi:cytochrome c
MAARIGFALSAAATVALVSPIAQAADAAKGAAVFKQCAACHNIEKGGGNGILGPNIFGVAGREAASAPNFTYSAELKNSGIVWTDDKLKEWVLNPQKTVPGTKMLLIHPLDAQQADDVVAYLNTKK